MKLRVVIKLMQDESWLTEKGTVAHVEQVFLSLLIGKCFFLRSLRKSASIHKANAAMLFKYSRSEIDGQRKVPYTNLASISLKAGFQQFHGQLSFILPNAGPLTGTHPNRWSSPKITSMGKPWGHQQFCMLQHALPLVIFVFKRDIKVFVILILAFTTSGPLIALKAFKSSSPTCSSTPPTQTFRDSPEL